MLIQSFLVLIKRPGAGYKAAGETVPTRYVELKLLDRLIKPFCGQALAFF